MGSLEAADFSAVNKDLPEQTILHVMLGTSTGKEQSQQLFLPGKSKQANTHIHIYTHIHTHTVITVILREY